MGGAGQVLKRIPRIKFPPRHEKASSSAVSARDQFSVTSKSDVPAPPSNTDVGGKASLQPKRTPVTDREIEAIQLGGIF